MKSFKRKEMNDRCRKYFLEWVSLLKFESVLSKEEENLQFKWKVIYFLPTIFIVCSKIKYFILTTVVCSAYSNDLTHTIKDILSKLLLSVKNKYCNFGIKCVDIIS